MFLALYRLHIIVPFLWLSSASGLVRDLGGWVGGEGFCEVSVFSGLCSWTCVCVWVGRALGSRLATKTQKPGSGAGWGGGCAVRPLLVGSLEEGLTMPLPLVLIALGGECKS